MSDHLLSPIVEVGLRWIQRYEDTLEEGLKIGAQDGL